MIRKVLIGLAALILASAVGGLLAGFYDLWSPVTISLLEWYHPYSPIAWTGIGFGTIYSIYRLLW